jgi:hypothetical protein
MIVGEPSRFAIEFDIQQAYPDKHFFALGMLLFHVGGKIYGVREKDATTFGNAIDGIETAIRGEKAAVNSALSEMPAYALADLFLDVVYRDPCEIISEHERDQRRELFYSPDCSWPNADEEFDDGSHILRFEIGKTMRLVAFKNVDYRVHELSEARIDIQEFRDVLSASLIAFDDQRQSALQRH